MRGKSAERGGLISPIGFHRLIQRVGEAAKMPFPIHPHMLHHACGLKLQGLLEGLTRIALSIAPACDDPRGGKVSGLGPAKGVCAWAWAMAQPEASARWHPGARQAPPLLQSPSLPRHRLVELLAGQVLNPRRMLDFHLPRDQARRR